jgi:predicted regulator of Ras-like GTPase activity (Roadblock/LC7/MglB family)
LQLEAEDGHVIVAGAGDVLVIAVAARDAHLGLVRVEAQRAAESLQ